MGSEMKGKLIAILASFLILSFSNIANSQIGALTAAIIPVEEEIEKISLLDLELAPIFNKTAYMLSPGQKLLFFRLYDRNWNDIAGRWVDSQTGQIIPVDYSERTFSPGFAVGLTDRFYIAILSDYVSINEKNSDYNLDETTSGLSYTTLSLKYLITENLAKKSLISGGIDFGLPVLADDDILGDKKISTINPYLAFSKRLFISEKTSLNLHLHFAYQIFMEDYFYFYKDIDPVLEINLAFVYPFTGRFSIFSEVIYYKQGEYNVTYFAPGLRYIFTNRLSIDFGIVAPVTEQEGVVYPTSYTIGLILPI